MAPRKTRSAEKEEMSSSDLQEAEEIEDQDAVEHGKEQGHDEGTEHAQDTGGKRKKSTPAETANKANKTTKSEQATKIHNREDSNASTSPEQVLKFLLSDAALEVCRPADELEELSKRGKDITTYSELLSPFEELLCAVILSRPISHRLGLRTIRIILNAPYEFKDTDTIKAAGPEKIHQALDEARTQHKGKTTEEIELIAEAVANNDWQNDLEKLREQTGKTVEKERELLRSSIKGLGKTGLDIFYRRIQWLWTEAFPFVDARTQDSLEKLGLPTNGEKLAELIDRNWHDTQFADSAGGDGEERKRRAFVLLLERAVGADLEKKIEDVLARSAES